jgi:ATP-binding cassette, subfamily C, bacterial LapB
MTGAAELAEAGPGAQGAGRDPASGLGLVAWFARHHRRPFTEAGVLARLPEGAPLDQPGTLAEALGHVGLGARVVTARIGALDPAVLPAAVFRKAGGALVLVRLSGDRKTATVIDPATGTETAMRRRDLEAEIAGPILLVAPEGDGTGSRSAPETAELARDRRHWFWGPVRENWPAWTQVVTAAFGINLLALAVPIFVMNVYDRVIPNGAVVTLWTLAVGVGIALALDLALRTLRMGVLEAIARRIDLKVGSRIFDQALAARMTARTGGAAGMANTIRDFEQVRDFFGSASFVALIDLAFVGVFVAVLFYVVGPLAWVPLCAIPLVLLLAVVAQVPLGRSAARAQQLATKRHVVLVESLLGIEAIKSLNAEPVMQREWDAAIAASSRIGGRTRFWSGLATNGTQAIQQGVSVVIIVWGVFLVIEGRITVGALIAANLLAGRALAPLAAIAQTIFRAHYARKAMGALDMLMAMPRERSDTVRSDLRVAQGAVEMREVVFRYPGSELPAIAGLSLDIRPGETVALLGRVGSGKTTVGKLLNGLLAPESGNILIDGHAIAQYDPAELREGVGYLTQDCELFTGTLRENMTIGRPGASDDEVRRALHLAGMDAFVAANPAGLDLYIGEKGNRLSGGQRQGVALARLLLRRPRVLFLDEPTNAMDQQMETAFIQRIGALKAEIPTLILCTHRMSLAATAERFIVLDQGRKVLDGPKEEVMATLRAAQARQLEG